jgi:hypothetical protein
MQTLIKNIKDTKVRKYKTTQQAIADISKSINKNMTNKYLKTLLNDSNNR